METKNTTIGYLVGKETFSPGDGDRWFGLDSEQAKYGFINYG